MQHLKDILSEMYESLDNKEIFIPLNVANAIIVYKLAHDDEVYWKNFSSQATAFPMENINDMYLFFIDFLPKTSQFQESYEKKIEHLKEFQPCLQELYYKQKFYAKNPDKLEKDLCRYMGVMPNPQLKTFANQVFDIVSEIRFGI